MRLYPITTSRAAPYDRTPTTKVLAFSTAAVAPHASTQRWTYTVPAGKKFIIGNGQASSFRDVVTATPSTVQAFHRITPNGGAATTAQSALWLNGSVTAGASENGFFGEVLASNDQIEGVTSDLSVGGSCTYGIFMSGSEFDA